MYSSCKMGYVKKVTALSLCVMCLACSAKMEPSVFDMVRLSQKVEVAKRQEKELSSLVREIHDMNRELGVLNEELNQSRLVAEKASVLCQEKAISLGVSVVP